MPKTPKRFPRGGRKAEIPVDRPREKKTAESIMMECVQILKSNSPREKKAELISVQSAIILNHIKNGIIPWKTGRRILRALQLKTEKALKSENLALAYAGAYEPKVFLEVESLVKSRALSKPAAARLVADYLKNLFSSKKMLHDLVVSEKPLDWKLKFIELNKGLSETKAKQFGLTQAMKDEISRKLARITDAVLDYEARKTTHIVNTEIFGAIEHAAKKGLITEEQKNALRHTAIKSQLTSMLVGRTKTYNYVSLEFEIRQLPPDMRADLIDLIKKLRASF
ncbi:MAG: hypothetical protein N3F05_01385 [Candidatus Diapherotrites archaeon]|nr:hypothetical protein [Candidatus Diapherotrites archaeon]